MALGGNTYMTVNNYVILYLGVIKTETYFMVYVLVELMMITFHNSWNETRLVNLTRVQMMINL